MHISQNRSRYIIHTQHMNTVPPTTYTHIHAHTSHVEGWYTQKLYKLTHMHTHMLLAAFLQK